MAQYRTAGQWKQYFGQNTTDQHKILVDILDATENSEDFIYTNGITNDGGEIILGGQLNQNTQITRDGNDFFLGELFTESHIGIGDYTGYGLGQDAIVLRSNDELNLDSLTNTSLSSSGNVEVVADQYLNVYGSDVEIHATDSQQTFEVIIDVEKDFIVFSDVFNNVTGMKINFPSGVIQISETYNFNYADDAAAAAGGIPISGIYHHNGALRIRLS